jgi:GT2 family glycosyltransferase
MTIHITASLVVYKSDFNMVKEAVDSLLSSVSKISSDAINFELVIIDNGPCLTNTRESSFKTLANERIRVLSGHGNIGFGSGHNLALLGSTADFFLVVNPDVVFSADSISAAMNIMKSNTDIGLLSPRITDGDGNIQYLCKRYPTLLLLFLRGFAPTWFKKLFDRYIRYHEFSSEIDRDDQFTPVIATGCLMFIRGDIYRKVGGFDPTFFLYFEDYDLSLEIAKYAKIVYSPAISIVHHGGGASRKGWKHIKLFITSAFYFFNKHGWKII